MHRVLFVLLGVASLLACESPAPSRQSLGVSREEALGAIVRMAGDKGWEVVTRSETGVKVREPETGDGYPLLYTAVFEGEGTQLTLSVHRFVGKFGQQVVWEQDLYEQFLDDLRSYL